VDTAPNRRTDPGVTLDFPAFAVALGEEASDPVVTHEGRDHRVDELAFSGHLDRMDEDLAAVAGLDVAVWRYGMPWRLTEPEPGAYDWTLWDRAFAACECHGLEPVVDLLHFGLPDAYGTRFADPVWVEPFLRYVDAFLARYPEPRWFTPINEPAITANFSAGLGIWNDRVADPDVHAAALGNIVRANLEALARLRADRDGWWVGAEGFHSPLADEDDPEGQAEGRAVRDREWAVWDLHLGVEPSPASAEVVARIDPAVLARIGELAGTVPDDRIVCGHDAYPVGVSAHGRRAQRPLELADRIEAYVATARAWSDRYRLPFWVSETSNLGLPVDRQTAWLDAMVDALDRLAAEGHPARGICWYSRGDQYDWDLALTRPVGKVTEVGLFDAARVARPAAAAYRALARARR